MVNDKQLLVSFFFPSINCATNELNLRIGSIERVKIGEKKAQTEIAHFHQFSY